MNTTAQSTHDIQVVTAGKIFGTDTDQTQAKKTLEAWDAIAQQLPAERIGTLSLGTNNGTGQILIAWSAVLAVMVTER